MTTPAKQLPFQWLMPPNEMAGRWANRVEVNVDKHGFTLDFFRVDEGRRVAILVARVTISDIIANSLTATLEAGLQAYAQRLVESSTEPLDLGDGMADNGQHE